MGELEDYDVYNHDTGEYLGSIEMVTNADADEMPESLEINGVCYHAEK